MEDTAQERVYEDTGRLVQSAVDGFNVSRFFAFIVICIMNCVMTSSSCRLYVV